MGKGNKNRNAYFYFMMDFKNQHGRNFKSMTDVATAASPHWQRLTPQERKKYEDLAKRSKENHQKQTSIGESVECVLQEEKEKKEKEIAMMKEIDNIVKKGVNTKTIADQYFYLMHINVFCYWEKGGKYFPAEIALGKFNLTNGIIKEDVYHSLVQPGPLPLGYSATARTKSLESHQIEHMGNENNTEEILMSVISKLLEDNESDNFLPIFVSEGDTQLVENVLNHMCEDYGKSNLFKLYSLQYLLFSLKNNISPTGVKVWPTISVSKMQLEKDVFDFCPGIACAYHEKSEIPHRCSRSAVIRWVYIVCDNCVQDLNISFIPGRHVPINALTNQKLSRAASAVSLQSSASSAPSLATSVPDKLQDEDTSETSTVVDDSEISSYHGFDSDSVTGDEEIKWQRPRRTKYTTAHNSLEYGDVSTQLSQDSSNIYIQLSQASSSTEYIPARRPTSQSGIVRGALSNLTRGRGRGLLQTRPPI